MDLVTYLLPCSCGQTLTVSSSQAGTNVRCCCGKDVAVPSLSVLRSQAGEEHLEDSPETIIRFVYGSGKNVVGGDSCIRCGAPATKKLTCFLEYEKPLFKKATPWPLALFMLLVAPVLVILYHTLRPREQIPLAEGKEMQVLLAVCPNCEAALQRDNNAREILKREPVFGRLFEKHPATIVTMPKGMGE